MKHSILRSISFTTFNQRSSPFPVDESVMYVLPLYSDSSIFCKLFSNSVQIYSQGLNWIKSMKEKVEKKSCDSHPFETSRREFINLYTKVLELKASKELLIFSLFCSKFKQLFEIFYFYFSIMASCTSMVSDKYLYISLAVPVCNVCMCCIYYADRGFSTYKRFEKKIPVRYLLSSVVKRFQFLLNTPR
jgi:hypothetical protein